MRERGRKGEGGRERQIDREGEREGEREKDKVGEGETTLSSC